MTDMPNVQERYNSRKEEEATLGALNNDDEQDVTTDAGANTQAGENTSTDITGVNTQTGTSANAGGGGTYGMTVTNVSKVKPVNYDAFDALIRENYGRQAKASMDAEAVNRRRNNAQLIADMANLGVQSWGSGKGSVKHAKVDKETPYLDKALAEIEKRGAFYKNYNAEIAKLEKERAKAKYDYEKEVAKAADRVEAERVKAENRKDEVAQRQENALDAINARKEAQIEVKQTPTYASQNRQQTASEKEAARKQAVKDEYAGIPDEYKMVTEKTPYGGERRVLNPKPDMNFMEEAIRQYRKAEEEKEKAANRNRVRPSQRTGGQEKTPPSRRK